MPPGTALFPPDGLTGGAGTVVEGGAAVASVHPLELAADAAATQVGLLVVFTATVAAYAAGHGVPGDR